MATFTDAQKARAELEREFAGDLTKRGIIRRPGKFEAEPLYVPYFYEVMTQGGSDEDLTFEEGEPIYSIFSVTDEDRAAFPELGDAKEIVLWEDDNGFVRYATDPAEISELRKQYEEFEPSEESEG